MVNYCTISGAVLDGAGNPVAGASLVFNSIVPQVVQGQYIQPVILDTITDDFGIMTPVSLAWGLTVQITINDAAPFSVVIPSIGAVSFGSLAMNAWPVLSFNPSTFFFLEDFPASSVSNGQIGSNGWTLQAIGGSPTIAYRTAEADHYGIIRLTTPAATNQGGALAPAISTALQLTFGLSAEIDWQATFVFRLNQTVDTRFIVGLINDFATAPAVTYMGLRYDTALVDSTFQFVCSNGGGGSVTLLPAALPDTNWHTFRMAMASAGTLYFSLDNAAPQVISTNLPTAGLTPAFQLLSATTVAKTVDCDFCALALPLLAR